MEGVKYKTPSNLNKFLPSKLFQEHFCEERVPRISIYNAIHQVESGKSFGQKEGSSCPPKLTPWQEKEVSKIMENKSYQTVTFKCIHIFLFAFLLNNTFYDT